ncbi:hypothetical protein [Priestia megaterium]|uniref:hypothetical protein n=1 Tax=Priestia megaterium TaxID=1404 RepID=UPI00319E80A7
MITWSLAVRARYGNEKITITIMYSRQIVFEISHFHIDVLSPDCVLTTYHLMNHTAEKKTLRSSIWRKREEKWRLFFHQGTVTNGDQ